MLKCKEVYEHLQDNYPEKVNGQVEIYLSV